MAESKVCPKKTSLHEQDFYELWEKFLPLAGSDTPFFLFESPDGEVKFIGLKKADQKEGLPSEEERLLRPYWFCLQDFEEENPQSIAPQAYLLKEGSDYSLYLEGQDSLDHILNLSPEATTKKTALVLTSCLDKEKTHWREMMEQAFSLLESQELKKIVLARKLNFTLKNAFHFSHFYHQAREQKGPRSYFMAHNLSPESGVFVSLTPETLFHKRKDKVSVDIIAGTRPRSEDSKQDDELLNSKKDRLEHQLVKDYVLQELENLGEIHPTHQETSLLKLPTLIHLFSRVELSLKDNISSLDLIRALHPTPAVGGLPKFKALAEIKKLEKFKRQYFAAPIGILGPEQEIFAVAIRSFLLKEREISFFAGAGIVKGSDVEAEWQETAKKMHSLIRYFELNELE